MSRKTSSATINQTASGDQNIQITGSYNTVIQRLAPLGPLPRKKLHYSRLAAAVCLLVSLPLLTAGALLPGWFAPALTIGGLLLLTSIVLVLNSAVFVRVLYYQRQVIRDYETYRRQNIHIELFANVRPDPFVESVGDAKRLSTLARESARPLVIFGDPGSGKTESLRWLAAFFARQSWGALPVRVELHDIARVFNDESSRLKGVSSEWLHRDIEAVLRTGLGRYDDILADQLFTLLKKGKLIVMVDALDELRYRSELPAELRKLMQTYPKTKYVLTCRRHDYSRYQAALGENVNLADLCPFGREDVVTFLQAQA